MELPPERPGHACPADLAARRAGMAAALAAGTWRTDPPPEETMPGGRRTLVFRPPGPPRGRMLHCHGGAYRLGAPEQCGPFAAAIATRAGWEVHAPHYRLAPEHPFPAGLADARAVLAAMPDDLPLVLSGDSAGGGMAAALAVMAAAARPRVAGLVLLSPWLDLTVSAPSYAANAASDPLFSRGSAEAAARLYLQGADPAHPLASPLFAALAGLPRTFVSVGSGEVVRDDARSFHARLHEAGVPAELCEIAGMEHTAVVRSASLPGAAETMARVIAFLADIAAARA